MRNRMNNQAHPQGWKIRAAQFAREVWSVFEGGFVFIAAKGRRTGVWQEHALQLPVSERDLVDFFRAHSREHYDLYFCPNAFRKAERKTDLALPSPYAWADIDDADPEVFVPPPGVLIESSHHRYQGLWRFRDWRQVPEAQVYSKALAYKYGADRNGWSITKYLRLPYTLNHKPGRHKAAVKLLRRNFQITIRPPLALNTSEWGTADPHCLRVTIISPVQDWREVAEKYRPQLHPRVRSLIWTERAYAFERDRSKCIFEIIAGLHEAGANQNEIAFLVFVNPYFQSKHGVNPERAVEEVARVIGKLEKDHG